MRSGVVGGWRRLHNEDLHNLTLHKYYEGDQVKEGDMSGEMRNAYTVLVGKPEGRDPSEDLGVEVRIILQWILGRQGGKVWTGLIWLRLGTNGGLL